jgi:hypothetical protein
MILLIIPYGGIVNMKKLILGIVFCMLLIIPVLSISGEAKEIVLMTGQGCNGAEGGNWNDEFHSHGLLFPMWHYVRANQSGNYVSVHYYANPIFMIVNGIPRVIKHAACVKLGLTEPETFAVMKEFIANPSEHDYPMGMRIFSICDSIEIELL